MSEAEDAKSTAAEDIKGDNDTANSKIGISRCSCRSNCLQDNGPVSEIVIGGASIILGWGIIGIIFFTVDIYYPSLSIVEELEPIVGHDMSFTVAVGLLGIPSFIIYITLCKFLLKPDTMADIIGGILVGITSIVILFIVSVVYFFATFEIR